MAKRGHGLGHMPHVGPMTV